MNVEVFNGDAIELFKTVKDKSVSHVLFYYLINL